MQAVILAAGEGTRLRPLTRSRPKAMIPVANRPIIEYVINALVQNGIRDIIVVVGYRKEHMIRHLNQLETPVRTVVQEKQLGTANALECAKSILKGDFLVLPGDNYIDPVSIARIQQEQNAMLVKEHLSPSNFGVAVIKDRYVQNIIEKPEDTPAFTVSTGIFSLSQEVFGYIESNELPDAVLAMIHAGEKIKAVFADDWQDAIYPWDILKMNSRMLKQVRTSTAGGISSSVTIRGPVTIGEGSTIGPHTVIQGPAVIGEDCEIASHCVIQPDTSVGSRVRIGPFTSIRNTVLMDDVDIGSHSRIIDSVMAQGCIFGDHVTTYPRQSLFEIQGEMIKAKFGAIIGDGVKADPFTVFKNCIVGNNVVIEDGCVVSGQIKDDALVM